jgi:hypothetical protein
MATHVFGVSRSNIIIIIGLFHIAANRLDKRVTLRYENIDIKTMVKKLLIVRAYGKKNCLKRSVLQQGGDGAIVCRSLPVISIFLGTGSSLYRQSFDLQIR